MFEYANRFAIFHIKGFKGFYLQPLYKRKLSSFNLDPSLSQLHKNFRATKTYRLPLHQRTLMTIPTESIEWPANKVRSTFLKFFEERGHTVVPSSSVVPYDDPTLLFANAGMNQFKPIFLGTVDPSHEYSKLKRAVDSQKCIRAGGKHNDLEDVGRDNYHHTMFEMLGNWSFGDYFKKEAIQMAWVLLTEVYGLERDQLYVTYFGGHEESGLEPDLEARQLWLDIGIHESRVIPGDLKDNFWEMGDQGPCGPCSEIHYDRIGNRSVPELVNMDDPNVLEIWNIVFIQYNREKDGSLRPLPNRHVDTGMGFERLVSVIQNKTSNYDTDVFTPLFKKIQELTGARPYTGKMGDEDVDGIDTAYRVVADHVRTLTFAISDGGVPNNEGRGYVLRRILRRGARYVRKKFGVPIGSFFSQLSLTVVEQMGEFFPELYRKVNDVRELLDDEEVSFSKTLDRGEKMFEQYAAAAKKSSSNILQGNDVWRLYETYGFPVDLTHLMAEEAGIKIDEPGFEAAQTHSKEMSKRATKSGSSGGELLVLDVHALGDLAKMDEVPKTDDIYKHDHATLESAVKAIYHKDGFQTVTKDFESGEQFGILLDRTNFYAEQGGQEYDTGHIVIDGVADFRVTNVQVYAGYVLHTGFLEYGNLNIGDKVTCEYDEIRRWHLMNNHTVTHVLNLALRNVLGEGIEQRGSLVSQEKMRFDFSYKSSLPIDKLLEVENFCNDQIRKDLPVYSKNVPLKDTKEINGLRAVFGEVYPDPVRLVCIGVDIDNLLQNPKNPEWYNYSIEFCGGTHVAKSGEIKDFVILEESGIAKGIRRIVSVTSTEANRVSRVANEFDARINELEKMPFGAAKEAELKKVGVDLSKLTISAVRKHNMRERVAKITKQFQDQVKAANAAEQKEAVNMVVEYFKENPEAHFVVAKVPISANPKALSFALAHTKKNLKGKSVYLVASDNTKVAHACLVSNEALQKITPQEWSQKVCLQIGGRSGGKGDTCQGVGEKAENVDAAIEEAIEFFQGKLTL
ncbi:cytoplasmic alanine-tRNA ligase Ala1 [Schizosaccharomyces cryophilus OY26]|uniref:Alanine--tRNA ligase n=1 Tax=Schizosaccharomyces cryophilus (strain OY26 / ATCC MYA-4695 / CBS 11777 / NBRC 106824 / NRRL Y48691) TaxID=653667 RepID=S9VVE2_SCHCR|nr:cytoplasmic alanine-tRNA ligase Ala1 [Schizosaccharomyces cryophilus OY26]EPY51753.1 cytoplasmic alanine-tRNA ligase Ala1 [Schizosaccharomyces cryophilus OY26]